MHKIAKTLFEAQQRKEKEDIYYLKGYLSYIEGDYKAAARHFSKLTSHEGIYLNIIANMKLGDADKALEAMSEYRQKVESWPHSKEKFYAIKKLQELRKLLPS